MRRPKRSVPIHNLRANHTSWTPPALISFDTETISRMDGKDEVMTLRCWCAAFSDRRAPRRVTPLDDQDSGMIADDLAFTIHRWAMMRRTVWAYAHNLGFDLTTSNLIPHLTSQGWQVTEFAVNSGAPFVRLRHGDHCLTLSDSWSWVNDRLEKVADAIGMIKPPLPEQDDMDEVWMARCQADTEILHTAMLTLMEWWDDNELGNWNITGSASGWNAMRHIPSPSNILIRPDADECDHDRMAIYGGRRSTWLSGAGRFGHYSEIDITKAYTTVCRDMPLPVGRQCYFTSLPIDHRWLNCDYWGIIAQCVITTEHPRVPCRLGNSVWYPVGTFTTVLAGPDIRWARDNNALVSIGPGWLHKLGYPLRPWATWCLNSLADETGSTPELAKMVHRMWARSAVGKWAQRGFEVIELGPSPNSGWHHEEAWHHGKNVPAQIVDFAGMRYQVAAVNQSDNAYPAILAFVESYVRVALSSAIAITGDADMVACDTDGYIARNADARLLSDINAAITPLAVRVKKVFNQVEVIGPQHMRLGRERRMSGIPRTAEPGEDGKLHAHTWPKMAWQLANGRPGAYVRPHQAYKVAATYATGWCLDDGTVVPVEMHLSGDGTNQITPFPLTRYAASGRQLGPHQNRRLERYRDG